MCVDVLLIMIRKAQDNNHIHGISIAKNDLNITHIFFVDDSLIFRKVGDREATNLIDILNVYQEVLN